MTQARHIAERYIATWNEADADRRLAALQENWSEDATYADPLATASGRAEIGALIGGVHARFPGFQFALLGAPDGHGDHVRFSWTLGPADGPAPIEGSDVVVVREGRIDDVIGFLDKVPQTA